MKINDIFEQGGVGVVANNAKQARDPRYSTSMTKDVKPGSTAKQAAKFGNKLGKDGTPPKLRETTINEKSLAKLDLTGSEEKGDVERKASRLLRFIEKIKNSEDFLTTKGDTVKIEPSEELIASISNKLVPNILPLVGGGQIKLSELEKTPDLGGEATGKRLGKEQAAMSSLNKQIEDLKGDQPYISLKVGDEIVNAASVINTPGTPKSDFEIIDENGDSVAWISHKDGSPAEPTKFGQWAGLSNFSSHIEVRRFVEMVRSRYPDGMPRGATALAKTISDENLQKQGVYGKNFGDANYGINNVTTVLQGPVKVEEDGDVYKIVALAEFKNGQELPESYTPIFVARYISDRSDFGVPHTRMSVYPMFGRKTDFVSDEDNVAAPISQEPELFHRVTRPDWYKDYKDKPDTKKDGRPLRLGEDAATDLKSTIVSLVKQTDDAKVLAKVLNTLKSSDLPDKLKKSFSQDVDANKMIDKLANTIVNMEGTAEEKIAFADNYTKGFVDVSKLLDGNLHSFEEIIPDKFALEVFKLFAINLTAQGVGPGEVALSILSPKINHLGRASGGGDIKVDGKAIEVKTTVSKGGRWVDARKARLNMNEIKKTVQEKTGIDIGSRMGIARWVDEIRPLAKNQKDLDDIAKAIAKGNFAFVDTSKIEKALKTGSAGEIKDAWASTGFDNYKAYSKFDGMLLMDAGQQWSAQYFNDYDSMRNNVNVKTVYMYGPESEAMPQVELISGKAATATTSGGEPIPAGVSVSQDQVSRRVTRPDWYKDYKDKPDTKSENPRKKRD